MKVRRNMLKPVLIVFIIIICIVAFLGIRALLVLRSVPSYKAYWENRQTSQVTENAFVYVALGDSAAQGIGASSPDKGYVGVIAARIADKTKRPVHVINLSVSGAKVRDAKNIQIPELQKLGIKPDLITIDIGSNDMRLFDSEMFSRELRDLGNDLPEGTVIAEISPYFKDKSVQANKVIHELAKDKKLVVAPLADILGKNDTWRLYAGDFFHPSNHGYQLWADGYWQVIEPKL
jgi:acyl-CoA thioesterase I